MFKGSKTKSDEVFSNVVSGLHHIYRTKLFPAESHYKFHEFHSPPLEQADFEARAMVLCIGQYSTGKTSFIRYVVDADFDGMRVGPEPTTDCFMALMHGEKRGIIPGNALVVDPTKQFRPLSKFGNSFLNRFQCSELPNDVLKSISLIDTPGILSGEKQRLSRGYEYCDVIEWFAERVDRIIMLFDAHKLDISDEFKRVIEVLQGYEDKIRIVLNKADRVDSQQLMRVYGALMWSLGKVLNTPEVARVYIGSFWNEQLHFDGNRKLFELEESDLFRDLQQLPRNAALRKLNDLIKRARLAKVHACIIAKLKEEMPAMFGKESKKRELIASLPKIFQQLSVLHSISPGDFPKCERMQMLLEAHDFTKFHPLKPKLLELVEEMLSKDVAKLMALIPKEQQDKTFGQPVKAGVFLNNEDNPFSVGNYEGINKGRFDDEWVINRYRVKYDEDFRNLGPVEGKICGSSAKQYMLQSKLPLNTLGKIWNLSDIDKDGSLDVDEFALACYLMSVKAEGAELPSVLPDHLFPPSKKDCVEQSNGDAY